MTIIGYARVSTTDQDTGIQEALAGRRARVDRLFGRLEGHALGFQIEDDLL
jgi:DNA invertase Pin-like site-specific DNA recombinase